MPKQGVGGRSLSGRVLFLQGFQLPLQLAQRKWHPHLRRIEVNTAAGMVSYPAPAAIVVDQPRRYGAVPDVGERVDRSKVPHARTKPS